MDLYIVYIPWIMGKIGWSMKDWLGNYLAGLKTWKYELQTVDLKHLNLNWTSSEFSNIGNEIADYWAPRYLQMWQFAHFRKNFVKGLENRNRFGTPGDELKENMRGIGEHC